MLIFSPTHKRTEGRAPVWGSEFTSKRRALQGGSSRNRCRLNVKMCTSVTDCAVIGGILLLFNTQPFFESIETFENNLDSLLRNLFSET